MSDPFQFEAQRPQDVIIKSTASRPYSYDISHVDVSRTQKSRSDIPSDKLPIPARTIHVLLESESKISVDSSSMSWNLSFASPSPLREGTVVSWNELSVSMGSVTVGSALEVALSGLGVHSYHSTNTGYDFRFTGIIETSAPSLISIPGTSSLSATLQNPSSALTNARVTLHRINGGNAWDSNTIVRVGLTLTEPGSM